MIASCKTDLHRDFRVGKAAHEPERLKQIKPFFMRSEITIPILT